MRRLLTECYRERLAGVLALPIGACRIGHLRLSFSVKAFVGHMRVSFPVRSALRLIPAGDLPSTRAIHPEQPIRAGCPCEY